MRLVHTGMIDCYQVLGNKVENLYSSTRSIRVVRSYIAVVYKTHTNNDVLWMNGLTEANLN